MYERWQKRRPTLKIQRARCVTFASDEMYDWRYDLESTVYYYEGGQVKRYLLTTSLYRTAMDAVHQSYPTNTLQKIISQDWRTCTILQLLYVDSCVSSLHGQAASDLPKYAHVRLLSSLPVFNQAYKVPVSTRSSGLKPQTFTGSKSAGIQQQPSLRNPRSLP